MIQAILNANQEYLASQVEVPSSELAKLMGLLPYKEIPTNFAMVFEGAKQIHMIGMRTAIDVMYLDDQRKVLFVGTIKPWRLGPYLGKTKWIIEARTGAFASVNLGETIHFE